ncbi:hypothetical protein KJ693_08520, partial [bacterium]|nr:hypothetical protein [bacterium]
YHLPKIWVQIGTGLNLRSKEERFDPLLVSLSSENLYLRALFDLNGKASSSMYGSFGYRKGRFKSNLGIVYAKTDKESLYLRSSADFPLSSKSRVNALIHYNLLSGRIYEKELTLFQDLHCLSGQLTFRQRPNLVEGGEENQIWLRIRIKAFEGDGLFLKFQD